MDDGVGSAVVVVSAAVDAVDEGGSDTVEAAVVVAGGPTVEAELVVGAVSEGVAVVPPAKRIWPIIGRSLIVLVFYAVIQTKSNVLPGLVNIAEYKDLPSMHACTLRLSTLMVFSE